MWYTIKHYVYLLIINIASMITRIMSFICKYNYRQKKKREKNNGNNVRISHTLVDVSSSFTSKND